MTDKKEALAENKSETKACYEDSIKEKINQDLENIDNLSLDFLVEAYLEAESRANDEYIIREAFYQEILKRLRKNNQTKGVAGNFKFTLIEKVNRKFQNTEELFQQLLGKVPAEDLSNALPIEYAPKWQYIKKLLNYGEDIKTIIQKHMVEEQGRASLKLEEIS